MKSKSTAIVLALFLGGVGLHKFYLGKNFQGFLYLVFCWTFIPAFISLLEGFSYMTYSQERWDKDFNGVGSPKAGGQKKCPDCAELVLFEAKKCKHCGCLFSEKTHAA